MKMNWKRLVPLSGILTVAFTLAAFLIPGDTPDLDAPLSEVASFYIDHDSNMMISGGLLGLAAFFFLVFSNAFAGALRKAEGETGGASALSYAGGIVLGVGLAVFGAINFCLGDVPDKISPEALQVFHVMNEDFFLPFAVGLVTYMVGTGAAIVKTGLLPKWIGWTAIVVAILGLTPLFPIVMIAFALLVITAGISLAREA
jgi:hypothetical protein